MYGQFVSAKFRKLSDVSEEKLVGSDLIAALTDKSQHFFFVYCPEKRILISWSDNALEVLGVKDSAIARDANLFLRHAYPEDRFKLLTVLEQALKGFTPYRATYRWIRPDNNALSWLHCRASIQKSNGEILFMGSIVDLTQEFSSLETSTQEAENIRNVLDAIPSGVLILDNEFRIVRFNQVLSESKFDFGDQGFKHDQLKVGGEFLDCFSSKEKADAFISPLQELLEEELTEYLARLTFGDKTFSVTATLIRSNDSTLGIFLNIIDSTNTVSLEHKLENFQRKEGHVKLTEGVLHSISNALQGILGHAASIQNHPENKEVIQSSSNEILKIVEQASELTDELVNTTSGNNNNLPTADLNISTMAAVHRVEDLFSEGIKIALAFGPPISVSISKDVLVTLIEDILRITQRKLQEKKNIHLRTARVDISSEETVHGLRTGPYARLTFSLPKEPDKNLETLTLLTNTPLELVKALGNKEQWANETLPGEKSFADFLESEGKILYEQTSSGASGITLYLKLSEPTSEVKETKILGSAKPKIPEILIADDDPVILETLQTMVTDMGHGCVVAEDGLSAMKMIRKHHKTLKLVLLDALMPGLDGATVLRKSKRLYPKLKILGFSGAPTNVVQEMLDAGADEVIRKPIKPSDLRERISKELKPRKAA